VPLEKYQNEAYEAYGAYGAYEAYGHEGARNPYALGAATYSHPPPCLYRDGEAEAVAGCVQAVREVLANGD
jgi:hypothetical protein